MRFRVGDIVKAPKGQLFKIVRINDDYADIKLVNEIDKVVPHIGKMTLMVTLTVTINQLELA